MKAIERFPFLIVAGGGLLGYVAGEMAVTDTAVADWINANAHWLHWALPVTNHRPLFVIGAEGDRVCSPDDVRATARHHGVTATILPGLAHLLMLERKYVTVAKAIEGWLQTI